MSWSRVPLRGGFVVLLLVVNACSVLEPPASQMTPAVSPTASQPVRTPTRPPTETLEAQPTRAPNPRGTPTADPPRAIVPPGQTALRVQVQLGDDLGLIAQRWGVGVGDLMSVNGLTDLEAVLYPGQWLLVPQAVTAQGPSEKILPDSELVFGPASGGFDAAAFVEARGGYLATYSETVEGVERSGADLLELAAGRYSVNPRLLLALLEYQSGWVTRAEAPEGSLTYPLGRAQGGTEGLFRQFEWAANTLNANFYGWRDGSLTMVILGDGERAGLYPGLNPGTAAVQAFFAHVYSGEAWRGAAGPRGLAATYRRLFGDPFASPADPLLPERLIQPEMQLPWAIGETWFYSAGPHGGWGLGSAWAALDFLPPGAETGCYITPFWARAVASGVIVRSEYGLAVLDLDGDGNEGTGWTVLYLHLADDGRAPPGAVLSAGDPVGRPSCEGGNSSGTHVHLARRYNGAWISPDDAPFRLGRWEARPAEGAQAGAGWLWNTSQEVYKVACDCRADGNALPNAP